MFLFRSCFGYAKTNTVALYLPFFANCRLTKLNNKKRACNLVKTRLTKCFEQYNRVIKPIGFIAIFLVEMNKKLIRNNKAKNEILSYLNNSDILQNELISVLSIALKLDIDLLYTVSENLEDEGFITSTFIASKDEGKLITITRKGRLFIKDGGYPSSGMRMIMKAIKDNRATIISVIAIIISILSYLKD